MRILFIIACLVLFASQSTIGAAAQNLPPQQEHQRIVQQAADDIKPINLFNYFAKASLVIQANVYFGNEDEESLPVETEFYLLDENLIKILQKAKFNPVFDDKKRRRLVDEDYLQATAQAFSSPDDEEAKLIVLLITDAISQRQSAAIKTNALGEGKSKPIKPGSYYLFGIKRIENEVLIWHQMLQIKTGINKIEIDQHNSDFVYRVEN